MVDRILVVGGGIIGLGIAWQLAKGGIDVAVIEARKPGRGASWAAAGLLAAHLQGGDRHAPLTRFQRHSQQLWPEFAKELEAASGREVGLRREGSIVLAGTRSEAQALQELALGPRGVEHGFRWLDGDSLRELEPQVTPEAQGALFSRFDHQVDNRAVVRALRVALERAGGELVAPCAVREVLVEGGRVVGLRTDEGDIAGDRVVLAAGAWSGRIAGTGAAPAPVAPESGQMLCLAMDPAAPLLRHVLWAEGGYLVPRNDGRLLVGATSEDRGFDPRHTAAGLAYLLGLVHRALPAALALPIEESWVGFRPASVDHLPVLGPGGPEGLYWATGHGHNGILMAPATIEAVVVHLVAGEVDQVVASFSPTRFAARAAEPAAQVAP